MRIKSLIWAAPLLLLVASCGGATGKDGKVFGYFNSYTNVFAAQIDFTQIGMAGHPPSLGFKYELVPGFHTVYWQTSPSCSGLCAESFEIIDGKKGEAGVSPLPGVAVAGKDGDDSVYTFDIVSSVLYVSQAFQKNGSDTNY